MRRDAKRRRAHESTKEAFWREHHGALMDVAETMDYDDWLRFYGGDADAADAVMDDTVKHRALALLSTYGVSTLKSLVG